VLGQHRSVGAVSEIVGVATLRQLGFRHIATALIAEPAE
jgi:hypothetical protein